jgi:hypothetical protein
MITADSEKTHKSQENANGREEDCKEENEGCKNVIG